MSEQNFKRLIWLTWLIGIAPLLATFAWGWYHGGFFMAVAAVGLLSIVGLMVAMWIAWLLRL